MTNSQNMNKVNVASTELEYRSLGKEIKHPIRLWLFITLSSMMEFIAALILMNILDDLFQFKNAASPLFGVVFNVSYWTLLIILVLPSPTNHGFRNYQRIWFDINKYFQFQPNVYQSIDMQPYTKYQKKLNQKMKLIRDQQIKEN